MNVLKKQKSVRLRFTKKTSQRCPFYNSAFDKLTALKKSAEFTGKLSLLYGKVSG